MMMKTMHGKFGPMRLTTTNRKEPMQDIISKTESNMNNLVTLVKGRLVLWNPWINIKFEMRTNAVMMKSEISELFTSLLRLMVALIM